MQQRSERYAQHAAEAGAQPRTLGDDGTDDVGGDTGGGLAEMLVPRDEKPGRVPAQYSRRAEDGEAHRASGGGANVRPAADDSKATLGGRKRGHGFAQRLSRSRAFLGYTDADAALVKATRGVVLADSDAIAGAVVAYLLSHRETAVQFARADGRTDPAAVEARQESFKKWLGVAAEAPLDADLSEYLAEVGRSHTGRDRGAGTRVNARYVLATMGFVNTELVRILGDAIDDRATLTASIAAWSKLLMIHLDLFLAVYASTASTAHWY
jgi:hypothetical protein